MRNEKGFTLIEMAFVLSVVFILTLLIAPFGFKWIKASSEKEAIDAIIAEIYSLQSYSIAYNEYTRLSFQKFGEQSYYIAAIPGKEEFARIALPEGMHVSGTSALKTVEFDGRGNIIQSGVLTIVSQTKRTAITFQFLRGRMIINESERILMAGSDINGGGIVCYIRHTAARRITNYNSLA